MRAFIDTVVPLVSRDLAASQLRTSVMLNTKFGNVRSEARRTTLQRLLPVAGLQAYSRYVEETSRQGEPRGPTPCGASLPALPP